MYDLDLDDVSLDGLTTVSDSPTEWHLPGSLENADDLFDWWSDLVAADDAAHAAGMTKQTRETLIWLAAMYEQLTAEQESLDDHLDAFPQKAKLRSVVRHICKLGLTTNQTAMLLNITQHGVVRALYCNVTLNEQGVAARVAAEQALRDGVTATDAARKVGLSPDQVVGLAKMLGIERVKDTGNPLEIRQAALDMRRGGATNIQISATLAEQGFTVPPHLVAQWWRRYGAAA